MAEHGSVEIGSAGGNDYPEHRRTYRSFVVATTWGTVSVAVILILMAAFLL